MDSKLLEWCDQHAASFGFTTKADVELVRVWAEVFGLAGYSIPELEAAAKQLKANPPKSRKEHFAALQDVITRGRERLAREEQELEDIANGAMACRGCGDTGIVIVPHSRYVVAGQWMSYQGSSCKPTMGVACCCSTGERIAATHSRPLIMRLEKYNAINPRWERQVAAHQKLKALTAKAKEVAFAADMERIRESAAAKNKIQNPTLCLYSKPD